MALVSRYRVPMKARIAYNVFLAVYAAAVTTLVGLDRYSKPDWPVVHNPVLLGAAVVSLAALTFLDAARRAVRRWTAEKAEGQKMERRSQLTIALLTVAELHQVRPSELGCGLFLRQPRGIKRPERLLRVERVRLPDDLHESPVQFTVGKGAVGCCWQQVRAIHRDWRQINERYPDVETLRGRWSKIPDSTRNGFSVEDFGSLLHKYAEVLTIPIVINSKIEGCLAIDRKWDPADPRSPNVLDDRETKKVMGAAAKTLAATFPA